MATESRVVLGEEEIRNRNIAPTAAIEHDKMAQRVLAVCAISPLAWRVWDALQTNLPGTAATDDLAIITGTYGTDAPYISAGDLKAAGATTRRMATLFCLPNDYEDAETVSVKVWAGMLTTVADTSCTVDVELWRIDKEDRTLGSADLISTAAQSINSLTEAAYTFATTATTLIAGDQLYIRISIACNDAATGTVVTPTITAVEVLADLR